jgi:hypothetical protein
MPRRGLILRAAAGCLTRCRGEPGILIVTYSMSLVDGRVNAWPAGRPRDHNI